MQSVVDGAVLLLLLSLDVGAAAAVRSMPTCVMQMSPAPPRPCGYIEHSDACCTEPLATRPIPSTQRHLASGMHPGWRPLSNVTFTALTDDALYLVSHDDGCGPAHECWEVSLGALGRLAPLGPPGATVEVSVSHLAGSKTYNVSLTTATVSRGGAGAGPGHHPGPGASTEDCRLLRGSTPVLDIVGDDANVRLVPPEAAAAASAAATLGDPPPPRLPPVCITLHSDQCRVDCRDFTVPPQCRRTRFHQAVRCVDKPFDSVMTFPNVTRLNISRFESDVVPLGPLLFHCARLQLGGCVVATTTVAVPLYPPSVRAEVTVPGQWPPFAKALAVATGVLLSVVLLLTARNFFRGAPGLPLLSPHLAVPGDGTTVQQNGALRSSLGKLSIGKTVPRADSVAPAPATSRILLVYCRPDSASEEAAAFSGAVRVLARILSASGRIEVTDMYEDPLLPEEGAVLRASTILADMDMAVVLVATPGLKQALRPTALLDLDLFQTFVTSLVLAFSHAPRTAAARLFTVCLDARHHPNFLTAIPVTAVFVMPYHVSDLLEAIPGLAGEQVSLEKQFKADEQKLRKYVRKYVHPEPETPVIIRI